MSENKANTSLSNTQRFMRFLCWGLISSVSLYTLIFFLHNKIYYFDNDTFYYLSVADSLAQNAQFRDLTYTPSQPLLTPQNAIVVLYYLIGRVVSSLEMKIQIVVILNYIALLLSIYPLLKIARILRITSFPAKMAIVAVYLCSWQMIRFQLSPINDGLFRTGSLWLIYWFLLVDNSDRGLRQLSKDNKGMLFSGCVLAILLIHFRLNAFVIPIAGVLAAVIIKKKKLAWTALIVTVFMAISLILPYIFIELSRINEYSHWVGHRLVQKIVQHTWNFFNDTFSTALFRNLGTAGNMLYSAFLFAVLVSFYQGYRKKEYASIFLGLVCFGTFAFLILFPAITYRLLLMVFPLLYLLMFREPSLRSIGYLFVFAVVSQSFMFFHNGIKVRDRIEFWQYVSQEVETESTDYLMITDKARQSYYFSGMSGLYDNIYTWQDIQEKTNVYIAGSDTFIKAEKDKMESFAHENHAVVSYKRLTPEYSDTSGNAFLRVLITEDK